MFSPPPVCYAVRIRSGKEMGLMSPSEAEAGEGGAGRTAPERQGCAALIRNVLDRLHIRYRSLPAAGGELFFCTPENGATFDLLAGKDGQIRLWRFVESSPGGAPGILREYRRQGSAGMAVGYEASAEGDVSFFACQTLREADPRREGKLVRMIGGYAELIGAREDGAAAP